MKDYSTLHLTQIKVKKPCFYCCSTFHIHNWVFNAFETWYSLLLSINATSGNFVVLLRCMDIVYWWVSFENPQYTDFRSSYISEKRNSEMKS